MTSESSRRTAVDAGGDRLRPHDHPRAAAVRRVVDAAMPADPPLAQVVGPDRRRSRAPGSGRGCSRRAAPRSSSGNSVRTSISSWSRRSRRRCRVRRAGSTGGRSVAGGTAAGGRLRREPGRRRGARPPVAGARRRFGGVRSSASASTTISPRRGAKIRTKSRTAGHVELAVRPAVDDVDLGAAGAVDVADRPEHRRRRSTVTVVPTTSCQKYAPRGSAASGPASISR